MDTIVYIDGFNFYYGCVAGTPHKWLNLPAVCEKLLPKSNITGIKYFSARVQARGNDPNQPARQEIYFRALRTDPRVEIVFGHFLTHKKHLPRVDGKGKAHVWKTEEKGSDDDGPPPMDPDLYDRIRGITELARMDETARSKRCRCM